MAHELHGASDVDAPADATATDAEKRFLQWLQAHGATFPKLAWPVITPNGLRGATAHDDIRTNEVMLSIPRHLMISEATCWSDPELGCVYGENRDVFARDDPVLALFLMREMAKGAASFYSPYLAILPEVETVQDWSEEELAELCDALLVDAAVRRTMEMKANYSCMMRRLHDKYPNKFPAEKYTFARFRFAWNTIQARTFGRRLPWTALVPFADCLNHTNVATKYDFDVDGNGCFRLYPSATNAYACGEEVFNSYGRRPNFQLLLDYGFALVDNEWEYVELALPRDTAEQIGRRFPFKKKLRLDRQTQLCMILPHHIFPDSPFRPAADDADATGMTTGDFKPRHEVLVWLKGILSDATSAFKCSRAMDELLRDEPATPERMRTAITYRLGRLRILENLIEEVDHDSRPRTTRSGDICDIQDRVRRVCFQDI